MPSAIDAVKQDVGKPLNVVTDACSTYVKLRDGDNEIKLHKLNSVSRTPRTPM